MDATLRHHGIEGQKWGVRRFQNKDGTLTELGKKRIAKEAAKDAKEYASAKMYYGKGAGTRRKLIKASVEQKMKDANYKEAFNKAVAEQDMAKRASEARTKRKVSVGGQSCYGSSGADGNHLLLLISKSALLFWLGITRGRFLTFIIPFLIRSCQRLSPSRFLFSCRMVLGVQRVRRSIPFAPFLAKNAVVC